MELLSNWYVLHCMLIYTFIGHSQGPWLNYFIDIANTYPYLWALYAIGLVLPFVLCAACCVRTKVGTKPHIAI